MSKIQNWEEQITKFKNLSLKNAKALYSEYLEDQDIEKKNILIKATLYISSKSAKELAKTLPDEYNIEDIISLTNEYYINEVENGRLLKIKNFSEIFDDKYKEYINKNLKPRTIEEPVVQDIVIEEPQPVKKMVKRRKLKVKMVLITAIIALICIAILVLGVYLMAIII